MMKENRVIIRGNEAVCRGAVKAGMRYYFGYPITPQNDVLEFLVHHLGQLGGVCVQAESEIASINMVYGAAAAGGITMTSTSSPGMSLMQEGISYLAGARLPAVILNVVRGGPGLGNIQPSQSDYFQSTRGGGHGDYFTPTFLPASVQEQYDLTYDSFEVALKYRTPVIIQTDGFLGQMMEKCVLTDYEPLVNNANWTAAGKPHTRKERNIVRSLYLHPEDGVLKNNEILQSVYKEIEEKEQKWEEMNLEEATVIVSGYGIVAKILKGVVEKYNDNNIKIGFFRPITGYPFPEKPLRNLRSKTIITVEMNYGMMLQDMRLYAGKHNNIEFIGKGGGWVPSPNVIFEKINSIIGSNVYA